MSDPTTIAPPSDPRPVVISLCGTYLKPEMQSIYRQITGLTRVKNIVYAQWMENQDMFPFERIVPMTKLHHRPKGNFLLRFWYKYIIRQWPPPVQINKYIGPCHPWNLIELLQKDQPALVHVYYGHKAVGFLPMLQEWAGPWIVSFHGVDVAKDIDKPEHLAQLRQVFASAQLVLARSQSLLNRLSELGCPEDKLRLNRTPIPFDSVPSSVRQPPTNDEWVFVQACRLIAKKGILTTLKALQQVVKTHPHIKYILCGEGPMVDKIRQEITARGLDKNVELRGWLDQRSLLAQYEKAHAFFHPSELTQGQDQEGIPNSMLEAMATGLPVVATRHGGIPEAVTHDFDGLLVGERSPKELATAILRLIEEPGLLSKLSCNAATSVREQFGAPSQIARLEDHYFEAITRAQPTEAVPS
jgi:colanic acid/amylovoran biosynthesis glycosyltransferase